MTARPIVLLVDDDPSILELLSAMFSVHGGFRIGGLAGNGVEGAMLALDVHPDVVVLDCFMPRWDGSKAAEFIRARCPDTKIVAFSAGVSERPAWADRWLLKTNVTELVPLVEDMLVSA